MKLMTYNILEGATKTLLQVIEVVKRETPDYLVLNEANGFEKDNNKILKEFAKLTGFPYFDLALWNNDIYHIAIFSKYPLKKVYKIKPVERTYIVSLIDSPLGELSIVALHLSPKSEDIRLKEIHFIIDFQKKFTKSFLMGDLNSISRFDRHSPDFAASFNEKQKKKFTSRGKIRFDVIDTVNSAGYIDTAVAFSKNKESTVPTAANQDIAHAGTKLRLDYIFVSKSLEPNLKDYSVIKNDLANSASDHYPVAIEFN